MGPTRRALVVLLVVGVALAPAQVSSAGPEPTWSRWFRASMRGVDLGPDRTLIVVGNTSESYPGRQIVLRRLQLDGTLVSSSSWAPRGGGARASGLAVYGGGVYVVGTVATRHLPEACAEIGSFGWFLRRSDADGTGRWVRTADGWRRCLSISGDAVGARPGVTAIGTTRSIEGYTDVHGEVRAFAPDGDPSWDDPFEPFPVGGPQGYDADAVTALAVDGAGRTYAAGWAWRAPRETGADHEAALIAYGRNGSTRWVRVLGEAGQPRYDDDRATDVDVRGFRVLLGTVLDKGDRSVSRVVMYDVRGDVRWTTAFPAAHSGARTEVAIGANGTAYVAMVRPRTPEGNDLIVRKLGKGGTISWTVEMRRTLSLRDLAVGEGRLYVLTRHHLWSFRA